MPDGSTIILALKVLVTAVTILFAAAVAAIATGRQKLHGRINTAFTVLTLTTVVGFEALLRLGADVTSGFSEAERFALRIHLGFAAPSAVLLPVMYVLGRMHRRKAHLALAAVFTVLWIGTFVTGVFFLPHR